MSTTSSPQISHLQSLSNDLASAVEHAAPSIVRVEGRRSNPASGIVWTADGLVLTAHHVLERDDAIKVVLHDERELTATLVGRDPGSDLAVLRLAVTGLPAATPAAADATRLGHLVLAVGRPSTVSATLGVVSAIGGPWRTWRGGQVERLIQTDAPFYPGFSGGALVNAAGEVVGLASSQLGRGLNLAVPADVAQGVIDTLLSHGRIRRGYLGIGSQPVELPASLRQRLATEQATGLLIVTLDASGPAEQAGVLIGDILIGLDGKPATGIDDLQATLAATAPGSALSASIIRGGAPVTVTITVGERTSAAQ